MHPFDQFSSHVSTYPAAVYESFHLVREEKASSHKLRQGFEKILKQEKKKRKRDSEK